jgi:hypothetical protein
MVAPRWAWAVMSALISSRRRYLLEKPARGKHPVMRGGRTGDVPMGKYCRRRWKTVTATSTKAQDAQMKASNLTRTFLLPYLNCVTLADHIHSPRHDQGRAHPSGRHKKFSPGSAKASVRFANGSQHVEAWLTNV